MNFEKIELIGFKSFADKCEIVFDNGVTAIVGPNGCGKSNIADAVRWVLGEQSAKTLRGSSMTDVIFNGTQNRKSLSYCEVSLYFDNSNHIFKSVDYNEVIMTRKLFRNGDSEYYINKQPSRMRDIIDLLHECGVSKSGYSIIGQGKVAEILSSKPADRRAIFEEAVGIAKSKASRLESERKLERTRDNILRLNDIMEEIQRQLEPATRAKEKTQKFLEFSEELKYHEINNYLYRRENAAVVKEKISSRIDALIEEYQLNERELEKTTVSYNEHMKQLSESDGQIAALHDEILTRSLNQEKLQGQTSIYKERISFFKSEIDRLKADRSSRAERLELLKKALAARSDELVVFENEKVELSDNIDSLSERLNALISQISEGENLNQSAQSEIIRTAETLAGISKNIGSLDTENTFFTSRQTETLEKIKKLVDIVKGLNAEKAAVELEISANEKLQTEYQNNIGQLEKTISGINEQISALSDAAYKCNVEISNLRSNQRIYSNIKESFEGYPASVRKLMLDAKSNAELSKRIKGIVGSVLKTEAKYSQAIESAIGNAVQNVITATPEDAQYLLEYLKRSEGGRVTFLPVSSVKPHVDCAEIISALNETGAIGLAPDLVGYDEYFDRVIQFLLGNTLVVDTSANALFIAKKYKFNFKIVTLDGDIFNSSGSITGGSKRSGASVMSAERMLETITARLFDLEKETAKLNAERETLTDKSNMLVDKLNATEENLRAAKQNQSVLCERLNSIAAVISDKEGELKENEQFIADVSGKLDEITKRYIEIEEGNKRLVEKKDQATSESAKLQEKYDKLRQERDKIIDELSSKKARLSALESETASAKSDIDRMEGDITETKQIMIKDDEDVEADAVVIENFYKEIEKLTLSSEESSGIKELRENLQQLEQLKQKLSDAIAQDDLKRQIHNSELTKLTEKRHEEEIAIAKVDSELEYMEQRVSEEYGLGYEDCVKLRDEEYNIAGSNQEIERLKRRIAMLGNINANAIEEYNALNERYNSQKEQLDDLYKAEADIKEAIKQLTNDMLATFNEGFGQIKEHFKRIFKELFGGGSADLVLDYTDVNDPLEAGVEIVAEPPGKKLQKISLLSGGEMSLTAIAILFAILKLRPMPFCVLDEIEAALDDANVERFARYLQNFSRETQFIVITHKQVTMELSDALFGVTMQEKGVSKIVSVKFSDIKDNLEA
ncbi:MAG: chromosome segregation protein SMC [Clostridia bacterium]|nr:chromosome segregation protein SMC [Clostridia bacterium]